MDEGDEPSTLEKERKMASMQGNIILGEKKKEAKARSASGISFDEDGTGPAGGLGGGQEAQIRTKTSREPPAECGRKEREEEKGWA